MIVQKSFLLPLKWAYFNEKKNALLSRTSSCRYLYYSYVDLVPPSSLARTEASFGRVHLTALGGIRELQHNEQDDNDDLFAVTHLNPSHGPETIDCKIQYNKP